MPPKSFFVSPDLPTYSIPALDLKRWQTAQMDLLKGRGERALTIYRDLVKKFPDNAGIRFEFGLAAAKELEFDLADQAFQKTAELSPGNIALRILLGQQYHQLRRMDRARACFEQAAAMDPDSIHGQLSLADWYERERRLDDAWNCIEAVAARHPADAHVLCYRALLLQRRKQGAAAEKILRELIAGGSNDLHVRYSSRHQLAVVLDEMGQHTEALRWLAEAKTFQRQSADIARMEQIYDQADRRRRRLLTDLKPEMIRNWRHKVPEDSSRLPQVLLAGHPRSGTTLLEQILGAHPAITAFDEPAAFTQEIMGELAPMENAPALSANGLDHLGESKRQHFRARYFKNLSRENSALAEAGMLLIKNPSDTANLYFWLRIFPAVKIIIALRDPRDVIISCYFQNLMLNATNANFLSLERTVKHYTDLMDVWLRLRELNGFDWIETRYDDLVADVETEGRRVTNFLGLEWLPQQAVFHKNDRKNIVVAPNYHEVAQPVYQSSVGRWRNYAAALAPFQERLAPYCRAFGYEI